MSIWDFLGFKKRKDEKKKNAAEAINSVEKQNEALQRTGFGRKYEAGGTIDQIPNGRGEFGRVPTNPIPVNGSYGEVAYLSRLRLKDTGGIVVFHRLGSFSSDHVCENPVDGFELMSLDGSFKDKLFLDMYHDGQSKKLPEGYTSVAKVDGLTGVPDRLMDFPNGIYEAVAQYSKQVFGEILVAPELRKARTVGKQPANGRKGGRNPHYFIERPPESQEYLRCWSLTGKYLENMFRQYDHLCADEHTGFNWLRAEIISPTFDSMNFRYKNRAFSVLIEQVIPVAEDAMMTKTTKRAKELQIKVCKENDMIPCLFIVDVEKMKPYNDGWNLINTETGEPVNPVELADDSPRPVSEWELMNWGITIVIGELKKKGHKVLSFTDAPGIMPQLWFENEDGEKCWVQVVVNRPAEVADFTGTAAEGFQGYLAGVMIRPFDDAPVLYRSHPAAVRFTGLEEIG